MRLTFRMGVLLTANMSPARPHMGIPWSTRTTGRSVGGLTEQAAESYGSSVLADHEERPGPYDEALAVTYDLLGK
jgi:hypothetical protein